MFNRIYKNLKEQFTPQQVFNPEVITDQLLLIHGPTFTDYQKIVSTLSIAISYFKSESFTEKENLIQKIIETQYLDVFISVKQDKIVNNIILKSFDVLQSYLNQNYFNYINNIIVQIQKQHPENIEPLPLILRSIDIKLQSSIGSINLPLTIQKEILELLITYTGVSYETRKLIVKHQYFFNRDSVLVQLQAGLKGEVITLIDDQKDHQASINNIIDILRVFFSLNYSHDIIFDSIENFVIANITKFISSQCYKHNIFINHDFAANLIFLAASVLNLVHQSSIQLFLKLATVFYPQITGFYVDGAINFYDKNFKFNEFQELFLSLFQLQIDESHPLLPQLKLKNALFTLLIQIISATANQSNEFLTFSSLAHQETQFGITVRKPSKSIELHPELLQISHLHKIAQISAALPRNALCNPEIQNPNPFVFEALQQFISIFTVFKYNDFQGDDSESMVQNRPSYSFRVEESGFEQVTLLYSNFRFFTFHLLMINPHFCDQISQIDEIQTDSVKKIGAFAAFLKANSVGRNRIFEQFQGVVDGVVDGRDERQAVVTGWLLSEKKRFGESQ